MPPVTGAQPGTGGEGQSPRQGFEERAVFLGLLLSLMGLIVLPGLFAGGPYVNIVTLLLFSLVLMIGVAATSRRRITVWIALLLAVPALGLRWVPSIGLGYADLIAHIAALLLILLTTTSILLVVLSQRRVTQDTLYGSVCAYLLMGVAWSILYQILESQAPGSFVQNNETMVIETSAQEGLSDRIFYFSLVTMTTLGFGDITPATVLARRLSVIEAIMGQLYVAILVARLVALQVAHASRD
jgi:hypothetical protein